MSVNKRQPDHISLEALDERERHYLMESDTFCIIPWVHLHAHPDGRAFACCVADMDHPLGNLREHTIDELWNRAPYRKLRLEMLAGERSAMCRKCHEREAAGFFSKRNSSNKQLGHHIAQVRGTEPDGSVPSAHLAYWDVRFSNLCNLSCRSCCTLFSTSWYDDHLALYGARPSHPKLMHIGHDSESLWQQLEERIDTLEKITFGGGEPLIMEEHYRILRELDRRKMYHVRLFYHTNFTVMQYKNLDVLELWNKFETVNVGASLDAMAERAELMRHGTQWSRVEANRARMLEQCPRVNFYLAPTLGLCNSLHLPDFHRDWVERGFITADQISISVLQQPEWLRIDALPPALKSRVRERYHQHIEWLAAQGPVHDTAHDTAHDTISGYKSALEFMDKNDLSRHLGTFLAWSKKLDKIRDQDTLAVFPELQPILEAMTTSP